MVYLVVADPSDSTKQVARPVPVRLGVATGSLIQVSGEIRSGQRVVVQGNERLRPGQAVLPKLVSARGAPAPSKPAPPTKSQR